MYLYFFGTQHIKNSAMGKRLIFVRNKNGKTPDEVFTESHQELVNQGREWLTSTSNACSVVAGLFVTVAFSTSTTVPDGLKKEKVHTVASKIFAGSSFVSFYTSLIAVIMFLSILTSGCRERDFRHALPWRLLLGLSAFYLSIASTLVCFTTGHFYIFRDQLITISSSSYVIACLLVTVFAILVFPLYFHLVWATSTTVPQRSYRLSIPDWLFIDE